MSNENGFTLVELIAVMVIISIIGSVIVKKIYALDTAAKYKAIEAAVRQLNSRELLVWTNTLLSRGGYSNDQDIFDAVDKNLGTHYSWAAAPSLTGGQLEFQSVAMAVTRQGSTPVSAARWK
jgi:prepilin-type N-terminal cleavage/methylation domain-containing protein